MALYWKPNEPEEWTPLPPDKKHYPKSEGYHSDGFPKSYEYEIKHSDERSFWKLIFNSDVASSPS